MAGSKPRLSVWEQVSYFAGVYSQTNHILLSVISLSFALVSYPFSKHHPEALMRAGIFAAVRKWYKSITLRQMQYFLRVLAGALFVDS
jgi:hypothetical protein